MHACHGGLYRHSLQLVESLEIDGGSTVSIAMTNLESYTGHRNIILRLCFAAGQFYSPVPPVEHIHMRRSSSSARIAFVCQVQIAVAATRPPFLLVDRISKD
jgi:hypothetical protein